MLAKKIIDSDLFMDMPPSTQLLYFHLLLRGDDEGFVGNTKNIMRLIGSSNDDYKILLVKGFIIEFNSGVCVIKHWHVHNYIQKDRFTPSCYSEEKKLLRIKEDKVYVGPNEVCTQNVRNLDTQISLDKISLVKNSKEEPKLPDWLDIESWNSWIQYRNEIKKPLTPVSLKMQLKFLEENKANHKSIILKSIECGWIGLFDSKNDFRKNTKPENVLTTDHSKKLLEAMKKKTIVL